MGSSIEMRKFSRVHLLGDSQGIWGSKGNPLQFFLPGESPGQRSLAGYSPWGRQESDTTEQLTLSLFTLGKQTWLSHQGSPSARLTAF